MTGTGDDEDELEAWGFHGFNPSKFTPTVHIPPTKPAPATPPAAKPEPPPTPAPVPAKVEPMKAAQPSAAPPKASRRGSENRKKNTPVTTRYDEAELKELDEAASRAGLTRASFQRVQSLAKPKTRSTRRAPIERETLAKVLGQLGKIGSNLNQIARSINRGRTTYDEGEIFAAVAELRALLPAIYGALGAKK